MSGNYNDQTAMSVGGWTCSNCGKYVPGGEAHTCPTVPYESGIIPLDGWVTVLPTIEDRKQLALNEAMQSFGEILAKHQIPMPPEFTELVSKHFWDLV